MQQRTLRYSLPIKNLVPAERFELSDTCFYDRLLFQFAHAGTLVHGEDLNLRVPLGETGLQPVHFGRADATVQTWRKVDESNAHRSSRRAGFRDQLPAIQQHLPHGGEYGRATR
jgi:hypothetical protein